MTEPAKGNGRSARLTKKQRPKRVKGESFKKYFYFDEGDLAYRITRGFLSPAEYEQRLEKYYPQLVALTDSRDTWLRMFGIALLACLLARYGVITEVSAFGIKVSLDSIKHLLLFALSSSICIHAINSAKTNYLKSLFDRYAKTRSPNDKADLLARYPRAFQFIDYYSQSVGLPKNFVRIATPWQVYIFLFFLISGMLLYIAFVLWIFVATAIDVWNSPTKVFGGWSKLLVVVSGGLVASVYTIPSVTVGKRRYTHTGIVGLLGRLGRKNPKRHEHFITKIIRAERNMGLGKTG